MKGKKTRKIIRMVIPIIAAVVIIAAAAGYAWFYNLTRSPLPQHDGELLVAGLKDTVTILRDEKGIPHIYASNMYDLFFAQGYTQAQDRWWQMEFFRHTGSGRIGELVGKKKSIISSDIFLRTVGWRQIAEEEFKSMDDDSLSTLQAFSDGVNAYIMYKKPGKLALEYSILGLTGVKFKIEPWSPVDTLTFAKIMSWDLGFRDNAEEARATLYKKLGQELTDQWLTCPWPFGIKPTILHSEDLPVLKKPKTGALSYATPSNAELEALQATNIPTSTMPFTSADAGIGSNNWVVSGKLSQSGMPLLANDPHLGIQMPSIWYEIGLHCRPAKGPAFDVVGFTFATTPSVIVGHNNDIAWGVTNVHPDVHDLYQIRVNPNNPLQYEWNGKWRAITVRNETIVFGDGKEPINIQVRETHLGPIINDNQLDKETGKLLGFNNKDPLALRWTALEPGTIFKAIIGLNKATNWVEFREALKYWDTPSQNLIYADTKGNIGYQMPGRVPIRSKNHTGLVPAPGWTDEFEWKGFIPYDKLPCVYNPARGYIVTANQAIVPPEYFTWLEQELGPGLNYNFETEVDYGYRAQRITQMIEEGVPHTISSFQAIQGDNKLLSAGEIMPYLAKLEFDDAELTEARDWLIKWDYHCDMDSPEAALYNEFWKRLVDNLFKDQAVDVIKTYGGSREMWSTCLLMENPGCAWWDDVRTKDVVENRDQTIARSFKEGYDNTVSSLGKNRNNWKWGKLHTSTFISNPLGQSGIGFIERIFNRGPFNTGGTSGSVNATYWNAGSGNAAVTWIPSLRLIVDLSDLSKSVCINNTGQSGHPYSAHYDDMIDMWRNIKYHPMLWDRAQIEAATVNKLVLIPGK